MSGPATVRFAPSPTGPPHLGNLRSALFNWLLARATGGRFILRIDDTDRDRYDASAEWQMLEALRWLGLDWDEGPDIGGPHGPYRQSERLALYHAAADRLTAAAAAYHPPDEPGLVRLKTQREGETAFVDAVRGEIRFNHAHAPQDPVLIRSDGFPTYHLATVVDDHLMGITHVLRGEEWIPSMPIHLQIAEALGFTPPVYAHLPLVTDDSGRKLSKRDALAQLDTYRAEGYLPDALVNALALLGWHPGMAFDVYNLPQIVGLFSLARISPSPSVFDADRLRWFNRQHMLRVDTARLVELCIPLIRGAYVSAEQASDAWLKLLVAAVHDEIGVVKDVVGAVRFAFVHDLDTMTEAAREALMTTAAFPVLTAARDHIAGAEKLYPDVAKALVKTLREKFRASHDWSGRQVLFPLRAALTCSTYGPHLSDVISLLGRDECLRRIDTAHAFIAAAGPGGPALH